MELLIGINLDNASFHDELYEDREDTHLLNPRGVAFCLTRLIDQLDGVSWTDTQDRIGNDQPIFAGKILDENGNNVGRWAIAAEPEDEDLRARSSRHG